MRRWEERLIIKIPVYLERYMAVCVYNISKIAVFVAT